jgi:hypothetical protein
VEIIGENRWSSECGVTLKSFLIKIAAILYEYMLTALVHNKQSKVSNVGVGIFKSLNILRI